MRMTTFVILAFAAVVADSSIAPEIEILGARPDLLVLVIVYGSLALGARPATIAGFLVGLVADSEMPDYLGLHALALTVIAYTCAGVWDRLVKTNVLVQCGVLFAATMAHDVIYYLVYYRNHLDLFARFLVRSGIPGGLYTAALGALVFFVAGRRGWRALTGDARG
jgi:rod shape-determining protein MreD